MNTSIDNLRERIKDLEARRPDSFFLKELKDQLRAWEYSVANDRARAAKPQDEEPQDEEPDRIIAGTR
jgi:hypothetical protein